MTAQITDTFMIDGEEFELIGFDGDELLDPTEYGLEPVMIHTACYRGFYCVYEVAAEKLILRRLTVRCDTGYPTIDGVEPIVEAYCAVYSDLSIPARFTGRLRLARGFHEECYVHMGFQDASGFDTVIDLRFDDGRLIEARNRSLELGYHARGRPAHEAEGDLFDWIDQRFSLEMQD